MRAVPVRAAAPTSTGTTDFTVSGGGTCLGAIFFLSRATADNTASNIAAVGYGATDGTRQVAMSTSSHNAQATTATRRRAMSDKGACLITTSGAIDGESEFSAFITDGIRINTTDAYASGYLITAVLFFDDGGDSFYVGTFDTSSGDVDVTAPGFRPSAVNVFSIHAAINDTSNNRGELSVGWAIDVPVSPPTQVCFAWFEGNSQPDGRPALYIPAASTKYANVELTNYTTVGGAVQLDGFDSSGFTAKQINSLGFACGYVAIKCANLVDVSLYTTPTSTGAKTHGAPGFYVDSFIGFETLGNATGSIIDSAAAGSWGFLAFSSASNEFSATCQQNSGATTTDTQSILDSKAINLPAHDGGTTDDIVGEVTAILSTGFEITYAAVATTARYFGGIAFQRRFFATGAGNAPSPSGSGSSVERFIGTGAGFAPAPSGSGSATHTAASFSATGAGSAPVPVGAGVALELFAGTAAGSAPVPQGSGAALELFTATGAGLAPVPQGAGASLELFTGSGAGAAPVPTGSGQGLELFTAAADGFAPPPEGSGASLELFTATAAGFAPVPQGSGSATYTSATLSGSGAGFAPVPVGAGQVLELFTGTAAGLAPVPVGSGLAALVYLATAAGQAPAPVGEGSGFLLDVFTAMAAGFAPVPVGDGQVLELLEAVVDGFAPVPVGAASAELVGFEPPPLVCPSQLLGSYVVAVSLLGQYLSRSELAGSYEVVSELEGGLC